MRRPSMIAGGSDMPHRQQREQSFARFRTLVAKPGRLLFVAICLIFVGVVWSKLGPPRFVWLGLLLGVLGGFLLLYGCVAIFPRSVSDKYRYDTSGRLTLENAIRSTFLQALLGAIVLIGAASTWQQLLGTSQEIKISRNTQITEQFSKASEDLGSDKVEVRLGAIYTLQRLTRTAEGEEGKQDSLTVYQLLAGYIKARS